uniref:Reverse transcriptase domain-containing protein n=2 Tax=Physcomitrium patens TaxID=3218 RepID=A0A2K1IDX8_PHYPA|nr:hypothetical protein PHYPA_029638 [Physcomitrium patens]
MPMLEELFDVIRFFQVFSILDLRTDYYQLLLLIEDWMKMLFLKVD